MEKESILVVDDRPENLLALDRLLEDMEIDLVKATSVNEALGLVLKQDFALVLLDVQMPGMDGYEVAELMRQNEKTKHIPIIFLTAINTEERHVFKGYESGAVDYMGKPIVPEILHSKVRIFCQLHRQRMELERANQTILEQQQSVVEEERLKVLIQMAGVTAHELNQPLMILLGNIELLQTVKASPEKLAERLIVIAESGKRIADTIKRIQFIQRDSTKKYPGGGEIIDINQ